MDSILLSCRSTLNSFFLYRHTGKKRVDESKTLTLDGIRNSLIRQEDSIIVSLLERAKYSYNADAYDKDAFFMDGFNGSLVEYMVLQTEKLHSQVGRYKSPDEHAFFPECLPEPALPPLQYPQVLHHCADSININNKIWNMYLKDLLPRLVKAGDDDNCGSVAVCDTLCLQVKEHGCLFFVTFLAHLLRGWSSGARVLPITGHKFVLSLISLERGKYNYLYKFSESGGFLCLEVRHHHAFLLNFKNALA
uniref:chorismate mutase n=1 Tax=Glycine max TaxID=3847 RepID=K7K200_SOYBN